MAIVKFEEGFKGTYEVGGQTLEIGMGKILPYDMTYGAIASCFWATCLDKARELGVEVKHAEISVTGHKRQELPTFVDQFRIRVKIDSDASDEQLDECVQYGIDYCSMVQTFCKVAKLEYKWTRME